MLDSQHEALIERSAISAEVARERGYRTVTEKVVLQRYGFSEPQRRVPALLIPIWDVSGKVAMFQSRPDEPRVKNGKTIKYETPRRSRMVLDVPVAARAHIDDPAKPLFITEGVRKADAAVSQGLCCLGLLGVWNWRGTNEHGGTVALADWELIALNGRLVYLAFDSDAITKPPVHAALARLKVFLESRGADVRIVYLPAGVGGAKVGLDDFLAAGHSVDELLALASPELRPPPGRVDHDSSYAQGPGGIVWNKPTRDGPLPTQLTNFCARIVADLVEDDGEETRRTFELETDLYGRTVRFGVAAGSFPGLSWVSEHLGPRAIVSPGFGLKDHARAAIQQLSDEVVERRRYTHTGWRQIDGAWAYLHAGGAIGADGAVPSVDVSLPHALDPFRLPAPPAGEEAILSVRASLRTLELAPDRITVPLLASVYRACLVESDSSNHLAGPTGAGKSELAALAQQHYGAGFDARNLPGSWSGTDNALEALAFTGRHALFVIDDFAPAGSQNDVHRLHAKADRVLRGQGNRSGRQRMRADTTLRPIKRPRGQIVSTGEDTPRGQSLRARLLVLELGPGELNFELLTKAQADAAAGLHAQAMAGFLAWVAARYEQVVADLPIRVAELRAQMALHAPHRRTPEIAANLQFGLELFLDYALEADAISQADHDQLRTRCAAALQEIIGAQDRHQQASEPTQSFLSLLASAISSGHAHLAHPSGAEPDTPEAWGWRKHRIGTGAFAEDQWAPQGKRVGWIDGDDVYLDTTAACEAATTLGQRSGEPLSVTPTTLRKRLHEKSLLKSTDPQRETLAIRKHLEGKRREVIHLSANSLEKPDHDTRREPDRIPRDDHTQLALEPKNNPEPPPDVPDQDNPTSPNPCSQDDSDPNGRVGRVQHKQTHNPKPQTEASTPRTSTANQPSPYTTRPQNPTTALPKSAREQTFLDEIDQHTSDGLLSPVSDGLRWAPACLDAEAKAALRPYPFIGRGRHVPNEPFCGTLSHRASDWIGDGGRLICGECHPPCPGGKPGPS